MTNLDGTMDLTTRTIKFAFAWLYDVDSKKWLPDKTIAPQYAAMTITLLLFIAALGVGLVGLLGLGKLTLAAFSNPRALLPLLATGLVSLAVAGIVGLVIVSYFQMRFLTAALTRQGFKPAVSGPNGLVNFIIMQALTLLAIAFSAFNRIGQILLTLTILAFLAGILFGKAFLVLGALLAFAYMFVMTYNGVRGGWATLHWFARGGGKREALQDTWTWMGGRTLKSFLIMFGAGVVTALALWVLFIPLNVLAWVASLAPGGSIAGILVRAITFPAQALTGAFMAAAAYTALSTEALGKANTGVKRSKR